MLNLLILPYIILISLLISYTLTHFNFFFSDIVLYVQVL